MAARIDSRTLSRQLLVRAFGTLPHIRHRRPAAPIRRIIVLRPDHLGDLLFATPALDLLRASFPSARITGAVGPWGRAMWESNPNLDALEAIRFPGITPGEGNALAPYRLLAKAARKLAVGRYDLGIVLRFDHWWGAALLWAAGVPRRWGYGTPAMRPWLTDVVPYTSGRHEVEQDLRLLQPLVQSLAGSPPAPLRISRNEGRPPLTPPNPAPPDEALLRPWLEATPSRRVVIHPGTAAANKLWTVRGWAEVADWLASRDYCVALTGAPDEQALCAAIEQAATGRPLNLAGRTASIAQLAWVMAQAGIVLGVDSGPLHIADALGKPTLHLYGPSDEAIWGPWGGPAAHRAFRAPGTRPTHHLAVGSTDLEGGPEMQAITPGMVMREIEALQRAL